MGVVSVNIKGVFLLSVSWDYTALKHQLEANGWLGKMYSTGLALRFKVPYIP